QSELLHHLGCLTQQFATLARAWTQYQRLAPRLEIRPMHGFCSGNRRLAPLSCAIEQTAPHLAAQYLRLNGSAVSPSLSVANKTASRACRSSPTFMLPIPAYRLDLAPPTPSSEITPAPQPLSLRET